MIPKKRSLPKPSVEATHRVVRRTIKRRPKCSPVPLIRMACGCLVILWTLLLVCSTPSLPRKLEIAQETTVVHVLQTRFMQFQPHLVALGWARLRLFQMITFPSVTHQTTSDFLWIIRADPQLDSDIRKELVRMVSTYPNIILVGSNNNPEGFRTLDCIDDITPESLWAGSREILLSYHQAAQTHVLLESRLDADDALLLDWAALLQADAAQRIAAHPDSWLVYCAENHIEWQYDSPWNSTTHQGSLVGLRAKHCVTAGLTWGYAPGVGLHDTGIVERRHQTIHQAVARCESRTQSSCLVRVDPPGKIPMALRARTPTSAGVSAFFE